MVRTSRSVANADTTGVLNHLITRHATTPVHPLQTGLFHIRESSLDRAGFIRRNFLRMDHHGQHVSDHNDD